MNKTLIVAALLATAPFAASAEKLSYSFIEAGYSQVDLDVDGSDLPVGITVDDPELSGLYFQGSVELGEAMYLTGGVRKGSDDIVFRGGIRALLVEADLRQVNLGLGAHHALSDSLDLFGDFSYIGSDFDAGRASDEGDDYRVGVGLRSQLAPSFEGQVRANFTDGDFYDSEFSAAVGAEWKFNRVWGMTGEAEFGSDLSVYTIGLRASF